MNMNYVSINKKDFADAIMLTFNSLKLNLDPFFVRTTALWEVRDRSIFGAWPIPENKTQDISASAALIMISLFKICLLFVPQLYGGSTTFHMEAFKATPLAQC